MGVVTKCFLRLLSRRRATDVLKCLASMHVLLHLDIPGVGRRRRQMSISSDGNMAGLGET